MAPNLMLLTLSPEIAGLPAQTAKLPLFARIAGFIVRSQARRAEHEVAR
jgi:hypothetical protein